MWGSVKNLIFRGGFTINQCTGGLPKKGALTICRYRGGGGEGGLARKSGGVLRREGGWYPNSHYEYWPNVVICGLDKTETSVYHQLLVNENIRLDLLGLHI